MQTSPSVRSVHIPTDGTLLAPQRHPRADGLVRDGVTRPPGIAFGRGLVFGSIASVGLWAAIGFTVSSVF
ncbi:MAG: hypothetical protein ACK4QW_18380 [Alphaproteobacteria bacterium]